MKELKATFLDGGYCWHPERMVCEGRPWAKVQFPSTFVLLEHPDRGYILFDTGYSSAFDEITAKFPYKLYAMITPVHAPRHEVAVAKLAKLGIQPEDIKYVLISHFHADHIGAIREFPNAEYVYLQSAWDAVKGKTGIRAVLNAFLPDLIPADFAERSRVLYDQASVKNRLSETGSPSAREIQRRFECQDLFGDGSISIVSLPGHTAGHMGIHFRESSGKEFLLVSDACWESRSYRELLYPHRVAHLIMENARDYRLTVQNLNEIHRAVADLAIVPAHCGEMYLKFVTQPSCDARRLNGREDLQ